MKLHRSRLGETSLPDGKRVLHKGEGVDLLTWVDFFGRATKHELTLAEGYVEWNRGQGVRTGRDSRDESTGRMRGSTLQIPDGKLNEELVKKALAIAGESKGDKYLEHLTIVLRRAVDPQAPPIQTVEVTKASPAKSSKSGGFLSRLFGAKR